MLTWVLSFFYTYFDIKMVHVIMKKKAAFRARDYIRKLPQIAQQTSSIISYEIKIHPNLRDKMFFN